MLLFLFSIVTQSVTFLPLAFGISISYYLLRATDMTIDGSFVLGAAVFARLVTLGVSPLLSALIAILAGAGAGILSALIQRGGRVDPLLAGVLATFILSSINLAIMGKPNISLLTQPTLVSNAFASSDLAGWLLVGAYVSFICLIAYAILKTPLGLTLRALGDNASLLNRLGKNVENYRLFGFAFSNALAAASGCLTAQTIGYADIGMGFGMTLTGIGAIILGQQIWQKIIKPPYFRVGSEFFACLMGVFIYFLSLNFLLRLNINPIYFKMILGFILIVFLRAATRLPNKNLAL